MELEATEALSHRKDVFTSACSVKKTPVTDQEWMKVSGELRKRGLDLGHVPGTEPWWGFQPTGDNTAIWTGICKGLLTWLNLRVKATTFGARLCFSFLLHPQLASS